MRTETAYAGLLTHGWAEKPRYQHPATTPCSHRLGRAPPRESGSLSNLLTRAGTSARATRTLVTISTELPSAAFAAASPSGDNPHRPTKTFTSGARRRNAPHE